MAKERHCRKRVSSARQHFQIARVGAKAGDFAQRSAATAGRGGACPREPKAPPTLGRCRHRQRQQQRQQESIEPVFAWLSTGGCRRNNQAGVQFGLLSNLCAAEREADPASQLTFGGTPQTRAPPFRATSPLAVPERKWSSRKKCRLYRNRSRCSDTD